MAPATVKEDYYAILETAQGASFEVIRQSYRRLALLHHPDKNGGSKAATEKFKLIAAAWETLGDATKRSLYDATYANIKSNTAPKAGASTASSWQNAWARAKHREQEQQESTKKRQQYCSWLQAHNIRISKAQEKAKTLKSDIEKLDKKDQDAKDTLAQKQPWFTPWTWGTPVISDEEKARMEGERLQRSAARMVKQARLEEAEVELRTLVKERGQRDTEENFRLRQEQRRRETEERTERERQEAEAAAQRKKAQEERDRQEREWAEQWAREERERQKAAPEARERAAKIAQEVRKRAARMAQQARERAEKAEKEAKEKREAEYKRRKEEQVRRAKEAEQRQTSARRGAKKASKGQAYTWSNNAYGTGFHSSTYAASSPSPCTHKGYWQKQEGHHTCSHCQQVQSKFALQCPGCSTMACHDCMKQLKRGETPVPRQSQRQTRPRRYNHTDDSTS